MWLRKILPPIGWWATLYCIKVCPNDMTKCVATAVTRNSESCRRSGGTIWSTSASSDLRDQFSTTALFPTGASLRSYRVGCCAVAFVECWQAIELGGHRAEEHW